MLVSRFSLISAMAAVLMSVNVLASESRFIVNNATTNTSDMELSYTRQDTSYDRGNAFANIITMTYNRTFAELQSFYIEAGFAHRDSKYDRLKSDLSTTNERNTALGFTDVSAGVRVGNVEDAYTWYYGGMASISPGAARDTRIGFEGGSNSGSNLSGYQSVGGVIGMESYVDKLALGAQFETRLYSDRRVDRMGSVETQTLKDRFIPKLQAFAEFPVVKDWNIGFNAAVTRPDYALDKLAFGGTDNHFQGMLYSQVKLDRETSARIDVGYKSQVLPDREDQNILTLGIQKAL